MNSSISEVIFWFSTFATSCMHFYGSVSEMRTLSCLKQQYVPIGLRFCVGINLAWVLKVSFLGDTSDISLQCHYLELSCLIAHIQKIIPFFVISQIFSAFWCLPLVRTFWVMFSIQIDPTSPADRNEGSYHMYCKYWRIHVYFCDSSWFLVRGYSRVQFLVSLRIKNGTIRSTSQSVEQVIYFSKYNVVLADVN